jgi:hypothetical protein
MKKLMNLMCAMLVSVYKVQEQEQELIVAKGNSPMPEETAELKLLNDTIQEAQVYMTALKGGEVYLLELNKEEFEFLVAKWKQADKIAERQIRDVSAVVQIAEILTNMGEEMDPKEREAAEKVKQDIKQGNIDLELGRRLLKKMFEAQTA